GIRLDFGHTRLLSGKRAHRATTAPGGDRDSCSRPHARPPLALSRASAQLRRRRLGLERREHVGTLEMAKRTRPLPRPNPRPCPFPVLARSPPRSILPHDHAPRRLREHVIG